MLVNGDAFVSVKEAALASGRPVRSVYHWARRELIRVARSPGAPMRVCLRDVLELAKARPRGRPCIAKASQGTSHLWDARRVEGGAANRAAVLQPKAASSPGWTPGADTVPRSQAFNGLPPQRLRTQDLQQPQRARVANRSASDDHGRHARSSDVDDRSTVDQLARNREHDRHLIVARALDRVELRADHALHRKARSAAEIAVANLTTVGRTGQDMVHRAVDLVLRDAHAAQLAERTAVERKTVKAELLQRACRDARQWLPAEAVEAECEEAKELLLLFIERLADDSDAWTTYTREGRRAVQAVADRVLRRATIDRLVSTTHSLTDEERRSVRQAVEQSLARFSRADRITLERAAHLALSRVTRQ